MLEKSSFYATPRTIASCMGLEIYKAYKTNFQMAMHADVSSVEYTKHIKEFQMAVPIYGDGSSVREESSILYYSI